MIWHLFKPSSLFARPDFDPGIADVKVELDKVDKQLEDMHKEMIDLCVCSNNIDLKWKVFKELVDLNVLLFSQHPAG